MGYYRGGAETSRSAATPRRQLEASSECCDRTMWCYCCLLCIYLLFIAASIVMIIMSESIKQGWYVTEALCRATNEWQCEFYQMATECKDTTDTVLETG